jgi:hypothetical protein
LFFFGFLPRYRRKAFSEEIFPEPGINGVLGRYGPAEAAKSRLGFGPVSFVGEWQ